MSIVSDLTDKAARGVGRELGLAQQLVDEPKDKAAISVAVALSMIAVAVHDMGKLTGETPDEALDFIMAASRSMRDAYATALKEPADG